MSQQSPVLSEESAALHATPPIQAVVHTGEVETRYRRAGYGPPVLLLVRGGAGSAVGALLMEGLAASCRVFAPESPGTGHTLAPSAPVTSWLRDVVDGLGLVQPCIAVDEANLLAALAFTLADPHRVGRLLVVSTDPHPGSLAGGALEDVVGRLGHPLLLVGLGADDASGAPAALMQMTTFVHCSHA